MSVSTLTTGIETRVAAVLGGGYSELGFVEDVTRNSFKGASQRYGVLAGDISQVETSAGVLGSYTVIQDFVVKVTDRWASNQAGDSDKRAVMEALMEKCLLIYKDLINNKAGSPSVVLNVLDGMSAEGTYHEDDGVAETAMNIQILYRKTL